MSLARAELVTALVDAFPSMVAFDMMLSTQLNQRRDRIIAGTGRESADELVSAVVAHYDERHDTIRLIRGAIAANAANPMLGDFIAKYPEWNPARAIIAGNAFDSVIIRGYRVFLRRQQYRKALQVIGDPPNSRVLAIDGKRCSGKSYSCEFLNYLLEIHPPWAGNRLIKIDLDREKYDSLMLAQEIAGFLPLDGEPLGESKHEQAARRLPDLIAWIGKGILKDGLVWWIVLDGFRVQVHPEETHDLIRSLIEMVDGAWGGRARLIVLNYDHFLDEDVKPYILQETIDSVEREDVEHFFRHVYSQSGIEFDDGVVTESVNKVLTQVDEQMIRKQSRDECLRLRILSVGLTQAARAMLSNV